MEKETLAQTLRWKITAEMKIFKGRTMKKEKEEIFALAYRIDCTVRIYEILLECCGRMGEAELESCIGTGGILDFLYERWLKEPDTQEEEMEHTLCSIIKNITEGFAKKHGRQEKQGRAG